MTAAFAVIASSPRLNRLTWAEQKSLVLAVAVSSTTWEPAGQLADALGVAPDLQEAIYREAVHHKATDGRHLAAAPFTDPPPVRALESA